MKKNSKLVACVDIDDLPLQILTRDRQGWQGAPIAVVAEDRPDALLTYVNHHARKLGLRTGMRYGAAKGLVPSLRAAPVSLEQVEAISTELLSALQTFSPKVERDLERLGVFYVDPKGLERIYEGLPNWAKAVHAYLKGRSFRGSVVVARGRFAAFAIARTDPKALVVTSDEETRERVGKVALERLEISPDLRDALERLGVRTAADFLELPFGELHARFGVEASRLWSLLADDPQLPMQAAALEDPIRVELELDPPDDDHARLLFAIKGALHELLTALARRVQVVKALHVRLKVECAEAHEERIEPARATRDLMTLLDLARLRLGELTLGGRIEKITLEAEVEAADGDQLTLFRESVRDVDSGNRALARLRAAYGERAVTRAELREAHLPEAGFRYAPIRALFPAGRSPAGRSPAGKSSASSATGKAPGGRASSSGALVSSRRASGEAAIKTSGARAASKGTLELLSSASSLEPSTVQGTSPRELGTLEKHRVERQIDARVVANDGPSLGSSPPRAAAHGLGPPLGPPPLVRRLLRPPKPLPNGPKSERGEALLRLFGPYRVSGGWWVRTVERDYYYGETRTGELLWLYFDRPRNRWFLQGYVD
jgi:protein ImuB